MKRCLIRTIVGAGVVIFAFGARILVAGPPPKDTSVLLTFGHTSADRLTSDGATVTVTGRVADYANGLQNVLSVVQGSGNFRFYTQIDARFAVQRRMCLDFGTQVLDQGPPYRSRTARHVSASTWPSRCTRSPLVTCPFITSGMEVRPQTDMVRVGRWWYPYLVGERDRHRHGRQPRLTGGARHLHRAGGCHTAVRPVGASPGNRWHSSPLPVRVVDEARQCQ